MPNYMQVGPGSYVPSGRPRVEPRPQPLGPPYEPGQDVMTENAAVAGSPFRQYLEEQFNRSREQGPPQFAPPPELAPINFEEIRGALKGIENPEMKRGPMTPEERKAFLFEWGLRSLGASGQPRASFAGAIGTGGAGALESHRGRRREDYDVSADRADRSRRGIVDDYSMQKDRYGTEERAMTREQARLMAEEQAKREHELALLGMAGEMMNFDQRAAVPKQYHDGVVFDPASGSTEQAVDASGNPLRSATQYEIDRRLALAEQLYGKGTKEALRSALRESSGMTREERRELLMRTASSILSTSVSNINNPEARMREIYRLTRLAEEMFDQEADAR